MKIRRGKKSDLKEIAELFRKGYSEFPYNEKWSKKTALDKIKEYLRRESIIFVLEEKKKIIGFIIGKIFLWERVKKGFGDELVIDKKFRNKGYGKLLINYMISYFKKKGVSSVEGIAVKGSKAFEIYKRMGMKEVKNFVLINKKI